MAYRKTQNKFNSNPNAAQVDMARMAYKDGSAKGAHVPPKILAVQRF
ncbi:MAG: hypothetical protein ACP5EP_05460 [Acidobacteriaceae bacterium]